MSAKFLATIAAVFLGISTQALARGPYGSIEVAGWSGGAFTDSETGKFSNCIASASYRSGIIFTVMVSSGYNWYLGFSHPSWRMNKGKSFPIILIFDNHQTINVVGHAITSSMVAVDMPTQSRLVKAFRSARVMSAFAQGSLFQFRLTGTAVLMPSLVNCVKTTLTEGIANARDFTLRPSAPPAMGPSATNYAETKQPTPPSNENHIAEATVIAANLLSQAGISGFKLATSTELPDIKADAVWIAGDVVGTINVMPNIQSKDLDEVKGIVIGGDAKSCKGTFFSGSIPDDGTGKEPITRVFTTCQTEKNPITSYYLAIPRKVGGMYILRTMTTGKSEAAAKHADASIRKAVFSAIPH